MGSMPALNLIDYNRIERIDCEVTHWKKGPCNATCGNGSRWKSRSITVRMFVKLICNFN